MKAPPNTHSTPNQAISTTPFAPSSGGGPFLTWDDSPPPMLPPTSSTEETTVPAAKYVKSHPTPTFASPHIKPTVLSDSPIYIPINTTTTTPVQTASPSLRLSPARASRNTISSTKKKNVISDATTTTTEITTEIAIETIVGTADRMFFIDADSASVSSRRSKSTAAASRRQSTR
jgi:hypothetical protein